MLRYLGCGSFVKRCIVCQWMWSRPLPLEEALQVVCGVCPLLRGEQWLLVVTSRVSSAYKCLQGKKLRPTQVLRPFWYLCSASLLVW
jgi:hypothetical protein